MGYADGGGSINVQGEEQKTLDVLTNDVLKRALRFTGKMGVIASEEEEAPVDVLEDEGVGQYSDEAGDAIIDEAGRYTAVFDPLDGSSNVDAGIPTGTIFGIFDMSAAECVLPEVQEGCDDLYSPAVEDDCEGLPSLKGTSAYELGLFTPACLCPGAVSEECMAATLQPGSSLVASGYCLYSSSTFFALTLGAGVQIFTLDPHIGEFVLTHPNVAVPQRGAIYSLNEANRKAWDAPLRTYIEDLQDGNGESGERYTARYIGSMVGDVHRTLLYGGIFGYPADSKNANGKLRLLYEAAPMAFLVEQAGGLALTWETPLRQSLDTSWNLPAGGRPRLDRQDAHHGPGPAERAPAGACAARLSGRRARDEEVLRRFHGLQGDGGRGGPPHPRALLHAADAGPAARHHNGQGVRGIAWPLPHPLAHGGVYLSPSHLTPPHHSLSRCPTRWPLTRRATAPSTRWCRSARPLPVRCRTTWRCETNSLSGGRGRAGPNERAGLCTLITVYARVHRGEWPRLFESTTKYVVTQQSAQSRSQRPE